MPGRLGRAHILRGVPVVILATTLGGCMVGPRYEAPMTEQLALPAAYPALRNAAAATATPMVQPVDDARWWEQFNDPTLTLLIDKGLTGNFSLAQAAERITQAREAQTQALAKFLPTIALQTTDGRNFNNKLPDTSSFEGQANVSWQIDLFGGLRRNRQAATRFLEAAGYDYDDIRTSVAAQIATNYITFRANQARLANARQALVFQRENEDIARWRALGGLVSDLDVQQARLQAEQTASGIPDIEQSLAQERDQIAMLIGEAPGAVDELLAADGKIPLAAALTPVGVPADVLLRRPDVRAAERRLAAHTALIGVARAQMLPQLNLTGSTSTTASALRSLGDVIVSGLFGSLSHTVVSGGMLRSQWREQKSATRESLAAYREVVVKALQEVADANASREAMQIKLGNVTAANEAAGAAASIARAQYRTGLTGFQSLLSAEQSWLTAQDDIALSRAALGTAQVQLVLALGGGWNLHSSAPATVAPDRRKD